MLDNEGNLTEFDRQVLNLYRHLSSLARKMLIEYAEKLNPDGEALRVEAKSLEKGKIPPNQA
ncbi:MAG: hypothetical protein LBI06_06545 [Treponema sp.]|jgi:hypothetical protein|nr:hypothetical protein [Treponema sp.]